MTTTLWPPAALVPMSCTTMSGTSTTLRIGGRTLTTRKARYLPVRGPWWFVAKPRWANISAMQSPQLGLHSPATPVNQHVASYQGSSCTLMTFLVVLLTRMHQLARSLRRRSPLPCQCQEQARKPTAELRTSSGSVSWSAQRHRPRTRSVKC